MIRSGGGVSRLRTLSLAAGPDGRQKEEKERVCGGGPKVLARWSCALTCGS